VQDQADPDPPKSAQSTHRRGGARSTQIADSVSFPPSPSPAFEDQPVRNRRLRATAAARDHEPVETASSTASMRVRVTRASLQVDGDAAGADPAPVQARVTRKRAARTDTSAQLAGDVSAEPVEADLTKRHRARYFISSVASQPAGVRTRRGANQAAEPAPVATESEQSTHTRSSRRRTVDSALPVRESFRTYSFSTNLIVLSRVQDAPMAAVTRRRVSRIA